MASNLNLTRYGGTIAIAATSAPSPPTISISTGASWMTISGSNVSIPAYSQADDRSASLSVTASTTANSSYNGTASVSCAWTVTQKGTGTTNGHITFSLSVTNNSSCDCDIEVWVGSDECDNAGDSTYDSSIIAVYANDSGADNAEVDFSATGSTIHFGVDVNNWGSRSVSAQVVMRYNSYSASQTLTVSSSGQQSLYLSIPVSGVNTNTATITITLTNS